MPEAEGRDRKYNLKPEPKNSVVLELPEEKDISLLPLELEPKRYSIKNQKELPELPGTPRNCWGCH